MTNSWRFSTLGDRHRALGSNLEDWSGMGTAWSYAGDPMPEYMAIRTKAGLMDVSGLKKVHITGPAASHIIERATFGILHESRRRRRACNQEGQPGRHFVAG